jgi:hypothetical protein
MASHMRIVRPTGQMLRSQQALGFCDAGGPSAERAQRTLRSVRWWMVVWDVPGMRRQESTPAARCPSPWPRHMTSEWGSRVSGSGLCQIGLASALRADSSICVVPPKD